MFLLWKARQSVSRVLSFKSVISLGRKSLFASSNQPWWLKQERFLSNTRHAISIWSCSRWGFPCVFCYQKTGVLLPHLFTLALIRRFIFCGTIPEVTLARCYLAPCSLEPGLSSFRYTKATNQPSGKITYILFATIKSSFFWCFFAKIYWYFKAF